jgi:hypothetical protein
VGTGAPTGVRFRSLGRHRLAGLLEPEALFQVLARGLRAEFPPPRGRPRAGTRSRPAVRRARPAPAPPADQLELPQAPA